MTHKRKRRAKAAPRRRPLHGSAREAIGLVSELPAVPVPITGAKRNPAKPLKRLNKSTGWMKASSVKIRRNKGKYEVLIRRSKPRRKAATKRPARRKTTRRRR